MQIIASHKRDLQFGDIQGAFLEGGSLDPRFRPPYAHQPPGGVPGLPADAVIEVLGNVYRQNDAPVAWFREFKSVAVASAWTQSNWTHVCIVFDAPKLQHCLESWACMSTTLLWEDMGHCFLLP